MDFCWVTSLPTPSPPSKASPFYLLASLSPNYFPTHTCSPILFSLFLDWLRHLEKRQKWHSAVSSWGTPNRLICCYSSTLNLLLGISQNFVPLSPRLFTCFKHVRFANVLLQEADATWKLFKWMLYNTEIYPMQLEFLKSF